MTEDLKLIRKDADEILEFVDAWLHGDVAKHAKIIGHVGGIKAMCDRIERLHGEPCGDAYELPIRVRRVAEVRERLSMGPGGSSPDAEALHEAHELAESMLAGERVE